MRVLRQSLILGVLIFASVFAEARAYFPTNPDPQLTPGSLCQRATRYRYAEKIAYCERDVEGRLKSRIIQTYNHDLGFNIQPSQRSQFKIDHLIPLCMGGSNDVTNLWPQHKSIYNITDPLEPLLCEKMQMGRLSQRDAVVYILTAKKDLNQARAILQQVRGL